MTAFTPETPLGQAVQALLLAHPSGLTLGDLRRRLRLEKGRHASEANLRELLRHGKTFMALSDGSYVLAGHAPKRDRDERQDCHTEDKPEDPLTQPLIVNLPHARHDYIVFDLETTGTDHAHDRIIQIAALKVMGGQPVAARTWYVNPGDVAIPYTVQVALGIAGDAASLARITTAPPIDAVLPLFVDFIEGLPLIAYNARFDLRFLHSELGAKPLPNMAVDAQELVMLLLPHLKSHRLTNVGVALDVAVDSLADKWAGLTLDSNVGDHRVAADTLHNAVTDVYLLHHVYGRLLALLDTPGPTHDLLHALLPEAFTRGATFAGVDDTHLAPLRARCAWGWKPATKTEGARDEATVEDLLTQHLAATGRASRPGQQKMRDLLVDAFAEDRCAMVEAPTGTGKTLAYLIAAVHHAKTYGERVALSTAYRNLQDQLLNEIDDLHQHGGVPFRSQVLKGVGNYLCWSQISRYLAEGNPRHGTPSRTLMLAERYVLAYVALWLPGSAYGTADDLSFWVQETLPIARMIIRHLRAQAACHPMLQAACASCPMPVAYANAQEADIVVINHALWLADPARLPRFTHLVLDEAHTLEDVATNALTLEVSSETLDDLLARLFDPYTQRGLLPRIRAGTAHPEALRAASSAIGAVRQAHTLVDDFGPYLVQFIRRCTDRIDPRYGASYRLEAQPRKIHGPQWQRVHDAHQQLFSLHLGEALAALFRLRGALAGAADLAYREATLRDLGTLIDELSAQRQLAYELVKVADQTLVYWLSVGPPRDPESNERDAQPQWWAMKAAPIDVGAALQQHYDRLSSVALVSATLAVRGNDFSYFIERLGLSARLDS